jgi:hypothetical protein
MIIQEEQIKEDLERVGFILNSCNQKTAIFQKENLQIEVTDLNCRLYD